MPDEFEFEPCCLIPRIDGGMTHVYRSLTDPDKFRISWPDAPESWTDHFQSMMDRGQISKN